MVGDGGGWRMAKPVCCRNDAMGPSRTSTAATAACETCGSGETNPRDRLPDWRRLDDAQGQRREDGWVGPASLDHARQAGAGSQSGAGLVRGAGATVPPGAPAVSAKGGVRTRGRPLSKQDRDDASDHSHLCAAPGYRHACLAGHLVYGQSDLAGGSGAWLSDYQWFEGQSLAAHRS